MAERPGRILVVDDELGMREGCRRILTPDGHEVGVAESGEAALEGFVPGSYDLALVDLKMPGISGIDLLKRLRALDHDLVCVIFTAYATLDTAVEATKSGAYDYLAKPFTPEELALVVDKALERRWLTAEAARLREQAERNLLLVTNREGSLVLYNPAVLRLLGIKNDLPALGQPPSPALFPADLLDLMVEALGGAAGTVWRELAGGPPHLSASVAQVRDEAGEPLGAVIVLRDITELKSLQQAMSDFVSMVAHELRSPLGAIAQYLDVLRSGLVADPEKVQHILARCRERTGGPSQLVRDLLDYSVMQRRGQAERTLVPLDLCQVVREVAEFMAPQAAARKVSISLDLPEEVPLVEADRAEMGRLFTNLLANAIAYNHRGGSVRISAGTTNGYLAVEVADTGVGIPQGALPRLGEAFFRVKTAETAQVTGTGLGLSICKQIVAAHEGHLEVESEEGKGSTFRVLLPRRGAARGEERGETASSVPARRGG